VPVSLQIKNLRVRSIDLDYMEVSWEISDTSAEVLDYQFQVLRSESPVGPPDFETGVFEDKYVFIDNHLDTGHRWRKYFYWVRVIEKRTGHTKDVGPASLDQEPDLVAMELRRHQLVLFHEIAGNLLWVLPVRTFGQRCNCFSQIQQKKLVSNCATCFETGFVRGYHTPIEVWGQIDPAAKSEQNTNVGAQQQSNSTGRCGWFPPLKPRDLVIEPSTNRRWRIERVTTVEHLRATVRQEFVLHEIPVQDIEFGIPLVLDGALRSLYTAPARAYSNPQNLDGFGDEKIASIFSLYGSSIPDPEQ
jgi:hypothetical protein